MTDDGNIEDLLKGMGETPKPDFTDRMMDKIRSEEELQDAAMRSVLTKQAMETAPDSLASTVMAGVSRPAYRPLISKIGWAAIFALVAGIILIAVVLPGSSTPSRVGTVLSKVSDYISISPAVAFALVGIGLLLALERVMRSRIA